MACTMKDVISSWALIYNSAWIFTQEFTFYYSSSTHSQDSRSCARAKVSPGPSTAGLPLALQCHGLPLLSPSPYGHLPKSPFHHHPLMLGLYLPAPVFINILMYQLHV